MGPPQEPHVRFSGRPRTVGEVTGARSRGWPVQRTFCSLTVARYTGFVGDSKGIVFPGLPCLRRLAIAIYVVLLVCRWASGASLKEAYDLASSGSGYDKYLVLETGVTYAGGLWIGGTFDRISAQFIGQGLDIRIVGNGAILDLQGQEICMAYCNNRLDIDDCVVLNGNIRFRGYDDGALTLLPQGSVRHITFHKPHDYGVRLFGCGSNIQVNRNIIVDALDTGADFMYLSGYASDWLPTGASCALSLTAGFDVVENWSYHSDPAANAEPLRHFTMLCDYG